MARSRRQAVASESPSVRAQGEVDGGASSPTPAHVTGVYVRQAADMVGASPTSVRTWERFGLVSPRRTISGYRVYSMDDIERLRQIQRLLNDGVNPPGIRRLLADQPTELPSRSRAANESGRARDVGEVIREKRRRSGLTLRGFEDHGAERLVHQRDRAFAGSPVLVDTLQARCGIRHQRAGVDG